jgi:hypothetical protein
MNFMMIFKPAAVVAALISAMLFSGAARALSQPDVGNISCDAILDYVATSPAYYEVFQSFLEGYLAGEKSSSKARGEDREAGTLMPELLEYCRVRRDASLASAVAATVKH